MSSRDLILRRILRMPALPTAVTQLLPLLQDPDSEAEDICRLISYDPGLTTYVLRYANSAALTGNTPVTSIRAALMRLGTKRIMSAVMSSAVAPIAAQPVNGYDLRAGSLWESSVAVALATEEFATILGTTAPAESFTAALLADIGKIVLGDIVELESRAIHELAFEKGEPFDQAEREILGIDHAEAGAALLESWNLPQSIVEVVRWHHEPERCAEPFRNLVDLIHMASCTCMFSGVGAGNDGTNYVASPLVALRLGLSTSDIERGMCQMIFRLEEARELFGLATTTT